MATIDEAVSRMKQFDDMAYQAGDEWSAEDISTFEKETGLIMPDQLKSFLLRYGVVGSYDHGAFKITFRSGNVGYTEIQVVGTSDRELMIRRSLGFVEHRYGENNEGLERGRVPPGYIFFGTAEGGRSNLLMKGDGSGDEAVYHWGLAYDPWMEGDNRTGIGYVAPSLADFLINLKPMAELD
jgi:hypothetical protein